MNQRILSLHEIEMVFLKQLKITTRTLQTGIPEPAKLLIQCFTVETLPSSFKHEISNICQVWK
jgi:hypothetical protein